MFSSGGRKFYLQLLRLTILFNHDHLFRRVEALNGIIWSKNDGDFVRIFSIPSFAEIDKQRYLISREIETHDFNGTQLKLTAFPMKSLVDFIPESNDTMITGVHGDIWQLLSSMFNFELCNLKLINSEFGTRKPNGSWDGVMGYIYRNETDIIPRCLMNTERLAALDFTLPIWKTAYRFYIKKQVQYSPTWMAELFDKTVWFSIVGLFFALSLASFTIHLVNFRKENSPNSIRDLRDHFFYVFSIFCNQGWTPPRLEKCSKIWLLSTRFFSWLVVIAFSSTLISHITQRHFRAPFDDLQSLYTETDYKLLVKRNSFGYSVFAAPQEPIYKKIFDARRLTQDDTFGVQRKTCTGRYVYFEAQDVVEARNSRTCKINFVGKPYFTSWVAGGLVRGFKYKRTMDLGILKLHEFGIIKKLRLKWLTKTKLMTNSQGSEAIKLEHVSLIFAMLSLAVFLSLVILLIENIVHRQITRQDRP